MATETQTLRDFYAALNRNDIPALLTFCDPEIERVEMWDPSRTYRGLAEFEAHVTEGRSTWAEGSCEPERFLAAADKVLVYVHVHARLKNRSDWIEGRIGDVFTFRKGKIIAMRSFAERGQAHAWSGIKADEEA